MKYKAVLFSPDGEDMVTDYESNSIDEVWELAGNAGSRWFFYPIIGVIRNNNTNTARNIILDAADEFGFIKNVSVKTAMKLIANNKDYVEDTLQF